MINYKICSTETGITIPKALKKFSNSALEVIQYATKIIIIDLTFLAHNYPVDYDDSKL